MTPVSNGRGQASGELLVAPEGKQRNSRSGAGRSKCASCPITWLIVAVVVGISCGLLASSLGPGSFVVTLLALPGKLWLKALKCIVLPMIVFSMIDAMVMLRSLPGARYLGLLVVGLYLGTTTIAAAEGCFVSAMILGPHVHEVTDKLEPADSPPVAERSLLETVVGMLTNLVPANVVEDAATNNLLPVIISAVIFGLLVESTQEDGSQSVVLRLVSELNGVVVKVITFLMSITPVGVASLVFGSAARLDVKVMGGSLGFLFAATLSGLFLHAFVFFPAMVFLLARRNPITYFLNIVPALATGLGTSSSAATLPVSISCAVEKNGISDYIANFVLSLGATINMDGTTIYLITATCFLGRLHGVVFGVSKYLLMTLLATLSSMGTAPIPSASLVLLATIMSAVGVPLDETFGLITAVDWMLDRLRTCVNIFGDACAAGVIDARSGLSNAAGSELSEESSSEQSDV